MAARVASLSGLYQLLHPELTTVPDELVERELAPSLGRVAASAVGDERPRAVIDETESAFRSATCKTFGSGSVRYVPLERSYSERTSMLWVGTPSRIIGAIGPMAGMTSAALRSSAGRRRKVALALGAPLSASTMGTG